MKKIIVLFSFVVFYSAVFAQNNNEEFIEVTISDSIQVEPEQLIFSIFFLSDDFERDARGNAKITENPNIKYVYSLLKDMKLDTMPAKISFNTENVGQKQISILFNSINDLREFSKKIRLKKGLQGFVSDKATSKLKEANEAFYEKLLLKAKQDALLLASKSQRELNKIIQITVKDIEDSYVGGWTAYPPLSVLRAAEAEPDELKVIVTKQITVRYSLK
ncbi:hypothetical protein [Lacibacter sp. H407]|uniref:hypothetical protein n=1 Tax=Lacibacter sp. H407 TaxID=3133423 RepID=UPI0030BDB905